MICPNCLAAMDCKNEKEGIWECQECYYTEIRGVLLQKKDGEGEYINHPEVKIKTNVSEYPNHKWYWSISFPKEGYTLTCQINGYETKRSCTHSLVKARNFLTKLNDFEVEESVTPLSKL